MHTSVLAALVMCSSSLAVLAESTPPATGGPGTELIESAHVSPDGNVHVAFGGEEHQVTNVMNNARCKDLAVSPDKRSVGWILVTPETVEQEGEVIQRFDYTDLVLFRPGSGTKVLPGAVATGPWRFQNDGRQIAYSTGPLHFGGAYKLYDIDAERVIDECNDQHFEECPPWVHGLQ